MGKHKQKPAAGQMTDAEFSEMISTNPKLRMMSLEQIAGHYPISERTLLRHIQEGKLSAIRFGRRYLVTVAALEAFIDQQSTGRPAKRK